MKITPYQRLLEKVERLMAKVKYPKRRQMWVYPKAKLNEGWRLLDLYERVSAAKQLGYDVVLDATEDGLTVTYVEKRPDSLDAA